VKLHIEGVTKICVDTEEYLNTLKMEYDDGKIFDFEFKDDLSNSAFVTAEQHNASPCVPCREAQTVGI
jgi:hypothetical protein